MDNILKSPAVVFMMENGNSKIALDALFWPCRQRSLMGETQCPVHVARAFQEPYGLFDLPLNQHIYVLRFNHWGSGKVNEGRF